MIDRELYDELDPLKVREALRQAVGEVPEYLSQIRAFLDRSSAESRS